jgi:hypothetical protein
MSSQLLNPNREALPLGSIDAGAERRSISGGRPTDEERAEFGGYLHIGNLLAVIKSKARVALRQNPPNDPLS